jgi:hypothetical protein
MVYSSYILCSILVVLYLFVLVRILVKLRKVQFVTLVLLLLASQVFWVWS